MGLLDRLGAAGMPADSMETALAAARTGDYATAISIWEPLARTGNARAQANIAACFAGGHGVEENQEMAARWLRLSAQGGDPVGQRNLATLYFRGEGVAQDDAEAMRLYRLAAEQGDAAAQDMLSWMLAEQGDYEEAAHLAALAAAQDVAAAMTRLGNLHHGGLGLPRDPAAAAGWWLRAAERGDADGQAMLGGAFITGAGVPANPEAALVWLLRAQGGGADLAAKFIPAARERLSGEQQAQAARRAAMPLQRGDAA